MRMMLLPMKAGNLSSATWIQNAGGVWHRKPFPRVDLSLNTANATRLNGTGGSPHGVSEANSLTHGTYVKSPFMTQNSAPITFGSHLTFGMNSGVPRPTSPSIMQPRSPVGANRAQLNGYVTPPRTRSPSMRRSPNNDKSKSSPITKAIFRNPFEANDSPVTPVDQVCLR